MELNHTIVWSKDRAKAVAFYVDILGLQAQELFGGHFVAVRINSSLTFDFAERPQGGAPQHYAFKVSEEVFDEILSRMKAHGIAYWSRPGMSNPDMKIYKHNGGRGVYFHDPDKNGLELLTADYDETKPFA